MITTIDIIPILKEIVNLLIAKQYKNIVQLDYLKNYSESELEESILDYEGTLTFPPKKAFLPFPQGLRHETLIAFV